MNVGDIIRLHDWPGTRGKRFKVSEIRGELVFAREIERKGTLGKERTFNLPACIVDEKATKEARERKQAS